MRHPIVTIIMQNATRIQLELIPEWAPNSVASFLWVANQGLYDGRTIDRVVKDYLIQPSYDGFGHDPACDFFLPGEFSANGREGVSVPFVKGVVGLAGDGAHFSSGSEFFILMGDYEEKLNGRFAAIGKVLHGWEELERIQSVETKAVEIGVDAVVRRPISPERINRVEVETWGITYPIPERLPDGAVKEN